ncbi:trigger factor [Nitrosomonas sp. Is37]|uniref:trigger factor n=1 Tax=Nitrosomonas sp. Is37 TaxID=3080535 RepID=UPI00294B1580|nr:trigger factor [Nitrosomonas sp. Is37]MDV6343491.1 trigger factor [Nitrosomonas sp. Is37]
MQSNVENPNPLERNLDISISQEKIQVELDDRLKRLAGKVKIQGFRPGKVPLKIVAQQFGAQLRQEVLGEILQKHFQEAVQQQNLRIVGAPHFKAKQSEENNAHYEFSATFEVYPDITLGDLSVLNVNKPVVKIGDQEVEKTLHVLQKQRAEYELTDHPAALGDRVNIDYVGLIDGNEFRGGTAQDFTLILGDGNILKDFENAIISMSAGDEKSFQMVFPADYHDKEIAGKSVTFNIKLNKVEAPVLADIDNEFAKLLGIEDGDVKKMYEEIRLSLEREVFQRTRAKLKEQIMQCLLDTTVCNVPRVLVEQEVNYLIQDAKNSLAAKGIADKDIPISPEIFWERAERRVKLGLILAEIVKIHSLNVKPEQTKKYVEYYAQSYENPEQVIKWHYSSPERLKEIESLVLEDNVVSWALEQVKVIDQEMTFEDLMGYSQASA